MKGIRQQNTTMESLWECNDKMHTITTHTGRYDHVLDKFESDKKCKWEKKFLVAGFFSVGREF